VTNVVAGARCRGRGGVAVGVETDQFRADVDGVGAVEVHVLVVGGPDMGEHLVVDLPAGVAEAVTARP